ncbi:glycosyltransferase family 2 protein [Nocardioides sp. 31GB23]|uniref:Cellulose synthase/poly-beta-1,6-N-acetylglucosamine synthase-like glycosyltransferase n=1 Tax=Nocardioides salarius TaxID=374513 RepID=A0ABS2MDS9_9ACTN|nr:glycosyltransferase family 2 protein [Nocardioides salarius]MBM7509354.1 cellulose synthase/poly-beta-1,6-N-acetylglucosamine synthase-like glycosyltransferase [Nocardioides salarius]
MSDDLRADQRLANDLSAPSGFVQRPDPALEAYAEDFLDGLDAIPTVQATVGCIIPAYNEAETIAGVLDSLLQQTRLPDVVHLIVNNTSDESVEIASHYAGPHTRMTPTGEQSTVIYVHDIGKNPDKKVGALNYGYSLVEHMDYLLGVDGDTTPEPDAIQHLVDEISSDDRIGGISAIYSIDDSALEGVMSKFLIAGQRAQFSAFNMQNLLKGRNMAVLGGQFSIFSTQALRDVMRDSHQRTPWVSDSEVEDSLLSLQIKSAGYLTKISARARAHVGGMTTLRSLDAQQVKWNFGAIDLMWPGQRGDTKGQPFHPNLRLRWFEHMSMVINMTTRFLFIVLLMWSLQLDAFVFSPLWLIPPVAAVWLNFRVAHSMQFRNRRDYLFVLLVFPAELYMMTRMGHFVRAWLKFFSKQQTDNWAAQAKAERGKGVAWTYPFLVVGVLLVGLFVGWVYGPLDIDQKSDVLAIGWPVLGIITVLQTAWMIIKASRRYRGFKA